MLDILQGGADAAQHAVTSVSSLNFAHLSAGIGAGIAVIGAGIGIGRIGGSQADGVARQPEAAKDIRGGSLILAAMIEGAALFGIVVALLLALYDPTKK